MKNFTYHSPRTLEAALTLLAPPADRANARRVHVLAGGQDLLTEMKEHLAEPDGLVNLKSVPGLDALDLGGERVRVGALVTLATLAAHADVRARLRVLAEAAASVASPQIRSVATVGGNLNQRPRCLYYRIEGAPCLKKGGTECFSYGGNNKYNAILGGGPSYIVHPSDLAPALVALDAEVELASSSGVRTLPLERYYTSPAQGDVTRETVRRDDEVLTRVSIPAPAAATRSTYVKFKERSSYDFALASVAIALVVEGGVVRRARLVLGGVAPVPWRSTAAETALVGEKLGDAAAARNAAEIALRGAEPLSQNAYKVPLAKALVERALRELA